MSLRIPHGVCRAVLAPLLLAAGIGVAPSLPAAEEGQIGAAFGDESPAFADPFPPEAFQEKLSGACPGLLDHRLTDLRGRTINLCAFSGKVLLVVNTASR